MDEGKDGTFTRPLGAHSGIESLQVSNADANVVDINSRRDQPALPGIDPGEKKGKRRPSPDRQRSGEKLRGDVRVRIFDITAKPGQVRVVLTGNRSGISVEQECSGNTIIVMWTLTRLWLRGAARLGK